MARMKTASSNEESFDGQINNAEVNPFQHSDAYPFCADISCPCHGNREAIDQLHTLYSEGLATSEDMGNIYRRRII